MPINSIDRLKSRFQESLATGGKITAAEADELMELVKSDGVTNSERRQLREQVIAHEDSFDPAARARLHDFVENQAPDLLVDEDVVTARSGRKDLPDPALPEGDRGTVSYEWTDGQVFKDGPSHKDVVQGQLGDCFVVSALAAVAAQCPEKITEAIKDNGDGTYTVRFLEPTEQGKKEHFVTIDGQLPVRNGGLRYAKGMDRAELWVPLLEKAYAQFVGGGYDKLHKGGCAGDVILALTGRSYGQVEMAPGDEKDMHELIMKSLEGRHPMVATTHTHDKDAMYSGTGLYSDHGYSVIDASEKDGKLFVTLRNPWGEVEPGSDGVDDGIFTIEMSQFVKMFSNIIVS